MENMPPVKKGRFLINLLAIVALAGIGTSGFLFFQYRKAQDIINNPTIQAQLEAKDLVKKISQLMVLPEGEEPTVATVSDADKLKDQPFFKNAQNGNKVLIYTKAQIAILYDPKINKILAVMPVNLGISETPIRIQVYNGTSTTGLANTVEEELKAKFANIVFSENENAKNTYDKTIVVDLTGNQQQLASEMATFLEGEIGSLPEGEKKPTDADLLIIVGK